MSTLVCCVILYFSSCAILWESYFQFTYKQYISKQPHLGM